MDTGTLIELCSAEFYVWIGDMGYDLRPIYGPADSRTHLPVAYEQAYATNGRATDHYKAGDFKSIIEGLSVGESIQFPDYEGCRHDGDTFCIRSGPDAWECRYVPCNW